MRRYLLTLITLLLSVVVHAQSTDTCDVSREYERAISMMTDNSRQYARARSILTSIKPHAVDSMSGRIAGRIAMSWYLQGCHEYARGIIDSAYVYLERALEAYTLLDDIDGQAGSLYLMGNIMRNEDRTQEAIPLLLRSRRLAEAAGNDHTLIDVMEALRLIYNSIGDREAYSSIGAELDSIAISTTDIGVKKTYMLKRGNEMTRKGRYDMAEYFYGQYIAAARAEGADDVIYAEALYCRQMTALKQEAGLYDEALVYGRKQIEISHRAYTDKQFMWYTAYLNHAKTYMHMQDAENLQLYIDSARVVTDFDFIDEENRKLVLLQCALYLKNIGAYDKALELFDAADSLGDQSDPYRSAHIDILALKGGILYRQQRYAEARDLYEQYAFYIKEQNGAASPTYARSLYYLANIEAYAGNSARGCELYAESSKLIMQNLRKQLKYVSSADRESYWEGFSSILFGMSPYAVKSGDVGTYPCGRPNQNNFATDSYNALLFSKGLLLESEVSLQRLLRTYGSEQDVTDYAELTAMRTRLTELSRNFKSNQDEIASLHSRMQQIDNRLTMRSKAYSDYTSFLSTSFDDIRGMLGADDVLVDFYDYFVESENRRQYIAYIITREMENPLIIEVFTQEALDSLLAGREIYAIYDNTLGRSATDLLWRQIEQYTTPGARVYYVPSGVLYSIALESLPARGDAGDVLGSLYNFERLSSARNIIHAEVIDANTNTATLYGGLTYDVNTDVMATESSKYDVSPLLAMRSGVGGNEGFDPLPESLEEINVISSILDNNGYATTPLSGTMGTEESFLSMDGRSPTLLHIATHGFYYTAAEADRINYLQGYKDAMSLSGLIMSGANTAWRGEPLPRGVLDGVLTAGKIARLDLSGTQMVVLSACRTARGNATAEGLFGLQRAFKKAGTGTMVMTLWNVSDVVTNEFMTTFYDNLATNGWHKRTAFEKAKQTIRVKYPEPFYWAAFVMVD